MRPTQENGQEWLEQLRALLGTQFSLLAEENVKFFPSFQVMDDSVEAIFEGEHWLTRADCNSRGNALVVDDGVVERLTGKAMLEELGFSVQTAASAEEALWLITNQAIVLVLCDVGLPGMDGLALLDLLRSNPKAPVFIMSTGHHNPGHAFASMRRGAGTQLGKPLRFGLLCQAVAQAMG